MMEKSELLPLPVRVDARALKSNEFTSRAMDQLRVDLLTD